jgi:hypothetical protein
MTSRARYSEAAESVNERPTVRIAASSDRREEIKGE